MNGGTRRGTRGWECFRWRGSVPMRKLGMLPLEGECTNEKVEHHIRIKAHKPIA